MTQSVRWRYTPGRFRWRNLIIAGVAMFTLNSAVLWWLRSEAPFRARPDSGVEGSANRAVERLVRLEVALGRIVSEMQQTNHHLSRMGQALRDTSAVRSVP